MIIFNIILVFILTFKSAEPQSYILKFKEGTSKKEIDRFLLKEGLKHVEKELPQYFYVVSPSNASSTTARELNSNFGTKSTELKRQHSELEEIEEDTFVKRVPRSLIRKPRAVTVFDAMWSSMWYLQSSRTPSMGVYNAWDQGYTGSGITIAFLDDGLDTTNADIANNYVSSLSYDYVYEVSDPSHTASDSGHGTSCAGIGAGVKNTDCALGIAYNSRIVAVKILDAVRGISQSNEAAALIHQLSNIHIYSNSWGPADTGDIFRGPSSIAKAALLQGVTQGRGGLGAIYTWAAGNGGDNTDDCNCDGFANSIYTISTTSVSPDRGPSFYSETCSSVLVGTYSGDSEDNTDAVITANRDNTCRTDFQGTSASCPMASGIIALVLQANPSLTWRDVQHLIVESSVTSGLNGASFTPNGAGKQVSNYFGFGLMNAEGMITLASNWTSVDAVLSCATGLQTVSSTSSGGTPIVDTFDLSGCSINYTEHITVDLNFGSDRRGRIEFFLISPLGTSNKLLNARPLDTSTDTTQWTFMSVHSWGEHPAGTWTLRMETTDSSIAMTLTSWSMTIYGTQTDPLDGNPRSSGTDSDDSDNAGVIAGAVVGSGAVVAGGVIVYCVKAAKSTSVAPGS